MAATARDGRGPNEDHIGHCGQEIVGWSAIHRNTHDTHEITRNPRGRASQWRRRKMTWTKIVVAWSRAVFELGGVCVRLDILTVPIILVSQKGLPRHFFASCIETLPHRYHPESQKLEHCHVVDPHPAEHLDDALAVFFHGASGHLPPLIPHPCCLCFSPLAHPIPETPHTSTAHCSFTTEDVLELHVHGGRAVINAVLTALGCILVCRLASPGEFTHRAYDGGRLDLTQVEGLRDLVDADTESQQRAALRVTGVGAPVSPSFPSINPWSRQWSVALQPGPHSSPNPCAKPTQDMLAGVTSTPTRTCCAWPH